MLDHLEKQCLVITDIKKSNKLKAALKPWSQEDDISTFFDDLDKIQKDLEDKKFLGRPANKLSTQ